MLNANDWPSFVQAVRPICENGELVKLFKVCTPAEEIRFKFYLMSGFRDAEGRFTTCRDVDFRHTEVRVTAKPHWAEKLGGKGNPSSAASNRPAGEIPPRQCIAG
jgi:hypothetical protein